MQHLAWHFAPNAGCEHKHNAFVIIINSKFKNLGIIRTPSARCYIPKNTKPDFDKDLHVDTIRRAIETVWPNDLIQLQHYLLNQLQISLTDDFTSDDDDTTTDDANDYICQCCTFHCLHHE